MYRCAITGKLSAPGELCNKVVVETRERIYFTKVLNEETRKMEDVEIGRGHEIVKEINVSEAGLKIWNAKQTTAG